MKEKEEDDEEGGGVAEPETGAMMLEEEELRRPGEVGKKGEEKEAVAVEDAWVLGSELMGTFLRSTLGCGIVSETSERKGSPGFAASFRGRREADPVESEDRRSSGSPASSKSISERGCCWGWGFFS